MFAQYYCSRRWALPAYGLGLLIIALWLCNAWVDLQMNAWTGRFYDELQAAFSAAGGEELDELAVQLSMPRALATQLAEDPGALRREELATVTHRAEGLADGHD